MQAFFILFALIEGYIQTLHAGGTPLISIHILSLPILTPHILSYPIPSYPCNARLGDREVEPGNEKYQASPISLFRKYVNINIIADA